MLISPITLFVRDLARTKTREKPGTKTISTYHFKESFRFHRFALFSFCHITSLSQQVRTRGSCQRPGPRTLTHMVPRRCGPVRRAGGRSHTRGLSFAAGRAPHRILSPAGSGLCVNASSASLAPSPTFSA